ncbi:MAG: hypothetical protein HN467_05480, partial [Opitutae bacterium]|nr:hypothetical protein [Opitutae bacterium]
RHPERVKDMAGEWFRIASDGERLKGKNVKPVKTTLSKLNFRKDTSNRKSR